MPLGDVVAHGREDADFSDPESLRSAIKQIEPDIIVNAAAYTAVDKAEKEEDLAMVINSIAPRVLAEEALKLGALLVHYSTDYVFDGTKQGPYVETDRPDPVSAYGRTKLAGERAIQSSGCDYLIFRTSWVYSSRGHNFLLTVMKLAKEREVLNIVSDQIGSPTSARLLSETTLIILQKVIKERNSGKFSSGLFHLAASGHTSWYGFAKEIISITQKKSNLQLKIKEIKSIATSEYPLPARRPANSRLSSNKLEKKFDMTIPDWMESLHLCINEIDSI